MASFPQLKTAAVAQYPTIKAYGYKNRTLRFVDGSEQRYRESSGPLHRWEIRLNDLDDTELAAVEAFFLANQGNLASFGFTDPWDGTEYANCSVASDQLEMTLTAEMRGKTSITVVENRY